MFIYVVILLINQSLISMVLGFPAQTQRLCNEVTAINCKTQYVPSDSEEICANNGITYDNKCLFVQAKCKNLDIEQVNPGKCKSNGDNNKPSNIDNNSERLTTKNMPQSTVSSSSEQKLDNDVEFCNSENPCERTLDPFCGSDFTFYRNLCEFKKAKCKNPDLKLLPLLSYCENKTL